MELLHIFIGNTSQDQPVFLKQVARPLQSVKGSELPDRLTLKLGKWAIKLTRSLTWKIWKPIGRHLLSWQCWRRVTFTLFFPGPAGIESGKQGLVWKEGKFLLPPALCPFFQHPCSCTVSHSPAGSSSQRVPSVGGGFNSLSNAREKRN